MTEEIKMARPDPIEPEPFEWVKNAAGEIIGAKTYEVMTTAEFKQRHPELARQAFGIPPYLTHESPLPKSTAALTQAVLRAAREDMPDNVRDVLTDCYARLMRLDGDMKFIADESKCYTLELARRIAREAP